MALFTPEELEELRKADAELDETFCQTQEERIASMRRDRDSRLDNMDAKTMKTMLRADYGLVVLDNGVIAEKYNYRDIIY